MIMASRNGICSIPEEYPFSVFGECASSRRQVPFYDVTDHVWRHCQLVFCRCARVMEMRWRRLEIVVHIYLGSKYEDLLYVERDEIL